MLKPPIDERLEDCERTCKTVRMLKWAVGVLGVVAGYDIVEKLVVILG